MKVLVVGAGGREHALCWALAASPLTGRLYCAPGSDAIAREATCVPLRVDDLAGIVAFCRDEGIELVVPGPELPLVLGLVDRLAAAIPAFGPSAAAARLEGLGVRQAFCARHGIPTAPFRSFTAEEADAARGYVRQRGAPLVVKADGLAAGGVTVVDTVHEALAALDQAFGGAFGAAGRTVVIEDCLVGEEASLFAWSMAAACWVRHRAGPSAPLRATPARTPAAWAPMRRRAAMPELTERHGRDRPADRPAWPQKARLPRWRCTPG